MKFSFFQSIVSARSLLLMGALNTIGAAFYSIIIGTVLGLLIGFCLTYGSKASKLPFRAYVDLIRGIPGLVTIFACFYMLDFVFQAAFGIQLTPFGAGVIALSVFCSAQVAEITRGALQSIPRGQIEAGKAIGMRFHQIFFSIVLPQALVQMVPPWVNSATEIVKGTTLLTLIGVTELLLTAQQLVGVHGHALVYYSMMGLLFFLLNYGIESLGKYFERKLTFIKS
jgi:polar amino acid transport system permease protein